MSHSNIHTITTDDEDAFNSHEERQCDQISEYLRSTIPKFTIPLLPNYILIRVHTGGSASQQYNGFGGGLSEVNKLYPELFNRLLPQYLNNDIVRSNHMTPRDVLNWLLESHIHALVTHLHQGMVEEDSLDSNWNVMCIEHEIQRLKFHLGDPSGDMVHDPVMLQDKFNYMAAIKENVLPTMKIYLSYDMNYNLIIPAVTEFCNNNRSSPDPDCCGFVIKLPYTTNKTYKRRQSVAEIISEIQSLQKKYLGIIPYCMLQAYLHDTVEFKVVCFHGKPLYEASIDNSERVRGQKKSWNLTKQERFAFVESVISKVKQRCPFLEVSSLLRVDLFWCRYLNKLVVNEIESLEARFDANGHGTEKEMYLRRTLDIYHGNRLLYFIGLHINQKLETIAYPEWPNKWNLH